MPLSRISNDQRKQKQRRSSIFHHRYYLLQQPTAAAFPLSPRVALNHKTRRESNCRKDFIPKPLLAGMRHHLKKTTPKCEHNEAFKTLLIPVLITTKTGNSKETETEKQTENKTYHVSCFNVVLANLFICSADTELSF